MAQERLLKPSEIAAQIQADPMHELHAQADPTHPEYQYLDALAFLMDEGAVKLSQASKTPLMNDFGVMHKYDLRRGFPMLTTKKMFIEGTKTELEFLMGGQTNVKWLEERGVKIWTPDAYKRYKKAMDEGRVPSLSLPDFGQKVREMPWDSEFVQKWADLGPVYGAQWRRWPGISEDGQKREIDQVDWIINKKLRDRDERGRKHILLTGWNPAYVYEMAESEETEVALPPCHVLYQFDVNEQGELSTMMYQRSCDMFLGVPFNIAETAMITHLFAHLAGLRVGNVVHMMGNYHIYNGHIDAVNKQLGRAGNPVRLPYPLPTIKINSDLKDINDFKASDITIEGYRSHPGIKAEMVAAGGRLKKQG